MALGSGSSPARSRGQRPAVASLTRRHVLSAWRRALATALELAREEDAKLLVVHADARVRGRAGNAPVFADEPDIVMALEKKVEDLEGLGCNAELVVVHGARDPGDLIVEIAQDRA